MTRDEALDTLGLSGSPAPEEINRAYAECARRYHPDLYATQPEPVREVMNEKMRRVNVARDLLSRSTLEWTEVEGPPPAEPEGLSFEEILRTIDGLMTMRRHSDALAYLDLLRARNGERPELLHLRALVLEGLGRFREAHAILCQIEQLDPSASGDAEFRDLKARVEREARMQEESQQTTARPPRWAVPRGSRAVVVRGKVKLVPEDPADRERCRFLESDGTRCELPRAPSSSDFCRHHGSWTNRADSSTLEKLALGFIILVALGLLTRC